ncbi:hypothetical protein BGZ99_003815 [Dissophora globulifera]|uniref:OTU domain-containing protein n=1 Tax=Dissophora globulifera TaxID=979702 RepID=A0A9P6RNR2_9FUNG|nr:hypothetical protein BGZ99_003815 [Dissophora globulifera]
MDQVPTTTLAQDTPVSDQAATTTTPAESYEELKARHKKEQRDLTARVTALKKTATKGDKKKKKEVAAEVAQLEHDLNQQQDKEENEWKSLHGGALPGAGGQENNALEEDDFDVNDIPIDHLTIDSTPANKQSQQPQQSSGGKKPNRQKARKDRKAQALKEMQHEAEKEAEGQVNMNEVERKAIDELSVVMGVSVKDITADGHCLYNAIADQLSQRYQTEACTPYFDMLCFVRSFIFQSRPADKNKRSFVDLFTISVLEYTCNQTTVKNLRHGTAEYMRQNSDDFLPFLSNKHGDMMSPEDFSEYCNDLESTAVWGGQPELLALSRVHEVPIWVVQMGSPTVKLSADVYPDKTPLMVSYHRHMYGLGEHYNSLRSRTVE